MILYVCNDPDILSILLIIKQIIKIIQVGAPICLIVLLMVDVLKATVGGANKMAEAVKNSKGRILSAVMIFLVPVILELLINTLALTDISYTDCLDNATETTINTLRLDIAEDAVVSAEGESTQVNVDKARALLSLVNADPSIIKSLEDRLKAVENKIADDHKPPAISDGGGGSSGGGSSGGGSSAPLTVSGYINAGDSPKCRASLTFSSEPSPAIAINYWTSLLKKSNFVFPKDSKTGLSLGSWPKNYATIKTKLSNPKTYHKGIFIWPLTPTNGTYKFVYNHNGIDIMAPFGSPIYSPASGTLKYSEWGHTVNKGCDETAYSVTVTLDKAVTINGVAVKEIFMTHMSGIRYRCKTGNCNRKVTKGELIGFVGNAAGTGSSVGGWAPHLHITFYNAAYTEGLTTKQIEKVYNISSGTKRKAGE